MKKYVSALFVAFLLLLMPFIFIYGERVETNTVIFLSGIYGTLPSTTGLVVNARACTVCDVSLTNDATILVPTNAPLDGRKLQLRLYAEGGDRVVTLASELKIPTSSSMSNVFTVVSNTTSLLLLDYRTKTTNWLIESYVWGY